MSTQHWDPQRYATETGFVADLGAPLLELLAPLASERILDLGCGEGTLTARLAAYGCAVLGIDSSAPQIEAALAKGLDARIGNGEALAFCEEFDGVFSNAALHWMKRHDLVLAGVFRALRPGGRFIGELGGHGNCAHIVDALTAELLHDGVDAAPHNPWVFPTEGQFRDALRHAGFEVLSIQLFARPTPFAHDVGAWITQMGQAFLAVVPDTSMSSFLDRVRERLRPSLLDTTGVWQLDYVRLRFAARRPA